MAITEEFRADTAFTSVIEERPASGAGLSAPQSTKRDPKKYLDPLILIAMLCVIAAMAVRPAAIVTDPDLWWHLRTGSWILQHGTLPNHEVFSARVRGADWIAYSWLFEVLTAKIFGWWGLRGIMALSSLLVVANAAVLTAILARYTHLVRAMLVAMAVQIPMFALATPRPWLFTILFFLVEFWLLLQTGERCKPVWLLPVVPLMVLWANIHIQFIYGQGLIGLFAVQSTFPLGTTGLFSQEGQEHRLSAKWLWALLAVSSLATLANPFGWRLYIVIYEYATELVPLAIIQELQALRFRDIGSWAVLGSVCLACFALGRARKKSPWLFVLMAAACYCGFRSMRDIWFPLIVSSIILAQMLRPAREMRSLGWRFWTLAILIGSGCAVAISRRVPEPVLSQAMDDAFPARACDFIEKKTLPLPLFNAFNWGGYLIWRLPNMPVSIDGRNNLYGDARLTRHFKTAEGRKGWDEDRDLMTAGSILIEADSPLASILRSDVRFRLVYEDKIASIFQPVNPPQATR